MKTAILRGNRAIHRGPVKGSNGESLRLRGITKKKCPLCGKCW